MEATTTPKREQPEVDLGDRRTYLGGSDSAAALGISPYKSRLRLYEEKLGLREPDPPNGAMRIGSIMEPYICEDFARDRGVQLTVPQGIAHAEFPFLKGHVDRIIDDEWFLEVKVPRARYGWGEPGTDQIPLVYRSQVAFYFGLLPKAKRCTVRAHFRDDCESADYEIARDDEFVRSVVSGSSAFWEYHVEPKIAPEPQTIEEIVKVHKLAKERQITAGGELIKAIAALAATRKAKKTMTDMEDRLKEEIMLAARGAATLLDEKGHEVCRITMRTTKEHVRAASTFPVITPVRGES